MSPAILTIPGLYSSGPDHWQSHFERDLDRCTRVGQSDWITPVCTDWIRVLDAAIQCHGNNVVVAAHSLGCATVAHWAARHDRAIIGALLVAPSDVEAPSYPSGTAGFTPMPLARLPFRTIVVASRDDPYLTFERARYFASCWGSEFEDAGNAGHLNTDAGYGAWPRGEALIRKLRDLAERGHC
jgi:uncharacterized protein